MSNTNNRNILSQEVRTFFKAIPWKKILTFLFFLLLSSIFWMMQVYRQKYDATLTLPVKYINMPDSIIFENELPTVVYARIKDDGANLFRYYLTKRNDSIIVDIRNIIKGTKDKVIQEQNLEQLIRSKLLPSSDIISYSPSHISYTYALLHSKKLPVIYNGDISLASGCILDGDLSIYPDSVLIYGSKAMLDTLYYAYTVSDTIENIKSEQKVMIEMKPTRGIKYIPNMVELTIPVDEFIQKEVEVPITCVNLPANLSIKFFPSSVKIPYSVGKKRNENIGSNNFEVKIDYNEIKSLKESSIPVRITESPDYIRTKVPIPAEVEFVLEKQ